MGEGEVVQAERVTTSGEGNKVILKQVQHDKKYSLALRERGRVRGQSSNKVPEHLPATPTDAGTHKICHSELVSESLNFGSLCRVRDDNNSYTNAVKHDVVPLPPRNDKNTFPRPLGRGIKGEGLSHSKKAAFTLAEVLITLGIIGIVAAMTIPTLITSYKKKVVESRLSKFYSTMNQAIKLSTIDNGEVLTWDKMATTSETDDDDNVISVESNSYEWFNKYIAPYIRTSKIEKDEHDVDGKIRVYFNDGSLVLVSGSSWIFYPDAKDYKTTEVNDSGITDRDRTGGGTKYFVFFFNPQILAGVSNPEVFTPYEFSWNGDIEQLKTHSYRGCYIEDTTYDRAYCAKLIQLNNWKIPDDYPWF